MEMTANEIAHVAHLSLCETAPNGLTVACIAEPMQTFPKVMVLSSVCYGWKEMLTYRVLLFQKNCTELLHFTTMF